MDHTVDYVPGWYQENEHLFFGLSDRCFCIFVARQRFLSEAYQDGSEVVELFDWLQRRCHCFQGSSSRCRMCSCQRSKYFKVFFYFLSVFRRRFLLTSPPLQMEVSACWLIQLLGIACLKKFSSSGIDFGAIKEPVCEVPREDIGMVWDGLCFGFLLIQKRLFKSYYFFHIVDETKAMSILASRGAELLEDLHRKRIEYQENVEKAVLQKLKFKMDKIKADQQRIQGPSYREPATHKVGKKSRLIAFKGTFTF